MCLKLTKAAWQVQIPSPAKLILIFLADSANPMNQNMCWPSIATIVRKTGLSERTVHSHLKLLKEHGHITMLLRTGKSTKYLVHPRDNCTPADDAPVQSAENQGANPASTPRNSRTQTIIKNKKEPLKTFKECVRIDLNKFPPLYGWPIKSEGSH